MPSKGEYCHADLKTANSTLHDVRVAGRTLSRLNSCFPCVRFFIAPSTPRYLCAKFEFDFRLSGLRTLKFTPTQNFRALDTNTAASRISIMTRLSNKISTL